MEVQAWKYRVSTMEGALIREGTISTVNKSEQSVRNMVKRLMLNWQLDYGLYDIVVWKIEDESDV